jgi:hypothetical protein
MMFLLDNTMRSRDTKGRFVKTSNSNKTKQQPESGGKYKDNKGRWHKSNGKYA